MPADPFGDDSDEDDEDVGYEYSELSLVDLDVPTPTQGDAGLSWDNVDADDADDERIDTLLFTATNPQATVSVTTLLGGRVYEVDLAHGAVNMTEAELAREILQVAAMATRQGKAGAHVLLEASMRRLGQDGAAARSFLERQLGLPAPDVVQAERAQFLAARRELEEPGW